MNNYEYSDNSLEKLKTCNVKLVALAYYALKTSPFDLIIASGHRNRTKQNYAFEKGYSKAKYGQSRHNDYPSRAIDIYPYINGRLVNGDYQGDLEKIKLMGKHILRCARDLNIKIKWGGHFDNFKDYPHFELLD